MSGHSKWSTIKHKKSAQDAKRGKIFQGSEFHDLLVAVKKCFSWVKVVKPDASRKESKEIYILAMQFRELEHNSIK